MSVRLRACLAFSLTVPCLACSGSEKPTPASPAGAGGAGGHGSAGTAADSGGDAAAEPVERWQPAAGLSWQYQLSGNLDTKVAADVFDVDLVETSDADIAALHAAKRKVVCYFDTAYEPYRSDAKQLEPYRGHPMDGWPGQYWVDIREPAVLAVMQARIEFAQQKHCDGVEADDVDARNNDPGFPLTAADQQGFIRKLAESAHAHDLAFGLKNDLDDVTALVADMDFAVNEQCVEYDECDTLDPFVRAKKPVFNVEYTEGDLGKTGTKICPEPARARLSTIIKHLELGPERYACP